MGMRPSNEASADQLEIARAQGDAYHRALEAMQKESGLHVLTAGDYIVGCTVEEAEGMYVPTEDGLRWSDPGDANCHLEVAVADRHDGRFVPELEIRASVFDGEGRRLAGGRLPFLWHPFLYHYGHDLQVPRDGSFTVRVEIAAPGFARHDPKNGRRYPAPVEVMFGNVEFKRGRKPGPSAHPRTSAGRRAAGPEGE